MRDIAVGEAGKAEFFFDPLRNTYYKKRRRFRKGLRKPAWVKVVIDEDGKVYFGDDTRKIPTRRSL